MRRLSFLIMATLALGACGGSGDGAVKRPETFTYLAIGDLDSLDPAWIRDVASMDVILQIYDTLVQYKNGSLEDLEPRIAESVPTRENGGISADGKTYRFRIREGVRFQDGSPLTPEDVRYSILRFCLQDRDGGPAIYLLDPILGVDTTRKDGAPDPALYARLTRAVRVEGRDVVVELGEPFAPFLGVFTTFVPVVSKAWAAANGDWDGSEATWRRHNNPRKEDSPFFARAMGSGAFRLERWDRRTGDLVLTRFDGHWRGPAALERIVRKDVPEFSTRKLMLQAGDADSIYADRTVAPEVADLDGVEVFDDLKTVSMRPVVFFTFAIDPAANPDIGSGKLDGDGIPPDFFADGKVRRAFAHLIDYDAFIADVARGKGTRAGGCVPNTLLGWDPDLPKSEFDLEKAAALFREARGGKIWEKGFRFTATYNSGNRERQTVVEMLKRNAQRVNPKFRIDSRPVQWSTYLAGINGRKPPLFLLGWSAAYPDPHAFTGPFLRSGGFFPSKQGFADAEIDRMIDEAKRESDPSRRSRLYAAIQRRAQELVPQIYIQHDLVFRTQRSWVKGWFYNPIWPGAPYTSELYFLSKV